MPSPAEMPLQEVLQALSRTPVGQPQLRAALATTCARWYLLRGESAEAVRHLGHALEMVPDLRPAMRLLYRIYLDRGDVRSAVMYLDQEIRATRHPREAAALYRERGQLVEAHFHDLAAADQCYHAALKATPRDLAVLRSVERVALARGDVFRLIANLEIQLEVLQEESAIAGVLHDLALLEARHRGDLSLAGDLLLAALERFGHHLVLARDLFRIAEVDGDAELMLHALELEAESRSSPHRALALARASVTLREHRERPAALALLHAAAIDQPRNVSLWRSLEELAMATARHDLALEACVGQLKAIDGDADHAARAELLVRLGRLSLFRLERGAEGFAAMRKAMRLSPGHPLVLEDTGRYLTEGGMWAQLLELAQSELQSSATVGMTREECALAHLRCGQIMEERLGELDGARKAYEDAIAAAPAFRPPRDRLERVLHQVGDAAGLRKHYADELNTAQPGPRRTFLLSVLAQLHASDAGSEVAIGYLTALLKEHRDHVSSIQLLARMLAHADRAKDLRTVTAHEIKLTTSPTRKAKLLHRLGELALQAGDRPAAREAFEQALEAVDDHLPSLESLSTLLRSEHDHAALVQLLHKELLYTTDRGRQVTLQLEIAGLLATHLGQPEEGLRELRALLQRWPRHLPALHAAEGLAATLGDARAQLEFLEQHIAAISGPRTRALLLHRAARLHDRLGDHESAIRALQRALELWPELGVARSMLLQLYERLGRARELQTFAEAGLVQERGVDDRRAMALQLAQLTPKPEVAVEYLSAVAKARPDDFVTQLRLSRAAQEAGHFGIQANTLSHAARLFGRQSDPRDPNVVALAYIAARAHEAAGEFDMAIVQYDRVLTLVPNHVLSQRGRARIARLQEHREVPRGAERYEAASRDAPSAAAKAALFVMAAEAFERRQDYRSALRKAESAIKACPSYLPALHTRARVLETMGQDDHLFDAIETLENLAEKLSSRPHRAQVLCHAGTLALAVGVVDEPNPRAWKLFVEAVDTDPHSPRGIRGLERTRDNHGAKGAPSLLRILRKRAEAMRAEEQLTVDALRELAALGGDADGPQCAIELLRLAEHDPNHPGLQTDLARAYARLGRWPEVVTALETALGCESSPERQGALHFHAGEANERANRPEVAIGHYLAAGRRGFHVRHALLAAERLAAETGALAARAEALQALVDRSSGPERVRSLRLLAELYRGPLGEPERALQIMRELLLLRPTDLEVIGELRRLLRKLERHEEAVAVLLAGIAHHRAWLRSGELDDGPQRPGAAVAGLLRLFAAMGERTGVYLTGRILERIDPSLIPPDRAPDRLFAEPWPLPRAQEGRPFDGLIGDLPYSHALDLLREGVFFLAQMPIGPGPALDLSPRRSLPSGHAIVGVVRSLAEAMGVPQPLVFVDDDVDDTIEAHITPAPCLIVGRRAASNPAEPKVRDAIGRALFRLATGGDAIHHHARPDQLMALLVALANAAGVEIDVEEDFDWQFATAIKAGLPQDALAELADIATAFRDSIDGLTAPTVLSSLAMAEDRAGAVCAADPAPALERVFAQETPPARSRMLIGYILSDDHLTLRRALGYVIEGQVPGRSPSAEIPA